MSRYEEYLYSEYGNTPVKDEMTLQASEAFMRLQKALGSEYTPVMEEIEAHYNQKVFRGYETGFRRGIRFLLNQATS